MATQGSLNVSSLQFLSGGTNFSTLTRTSDGVVTWSSAGGAGNNVLIKGLVNPVDPQDSATKQYVDGIAGAGVTWKNAVRAATTADGDIATDFEPGDIIDTVTLAQGDRILIKDQASPSENGIYVVKASGEPDRATDAGTNDQASGAAVFAFEGSTNNDKGFVCTTDGPVNFGVATSWSVFSATGGAAAGGDTQVQYNADGAGTFGAVASFTFNKSTTTPSLSVGADAVSTSADMNIGTGTSVTAATLDIGAGTATNTTATINLADGTGASLIQHQSTGTLTIENQAVAADTIMKLGDAAGATSFTVADSGDAVQFDMNSDGTSFQLGSADIRGGTVENTTGGLTVGAAGSVIIDSADQSGTPSESTGSILEVQAQTFTDSATAGSGTALFQSFNTIAAPTLAATNTSVTTTDAATMYIAGSPIAGTNETITNGWALYVDTAGAGGGDVFIGGDLTLGGTLTQTLADTQFFIGNSSNEAAASTDAFTYDIATASVFSVSADATSQSLVTNLGTGSSVTDSTLNIGADTATNTNGAIELGDGSGAGTIDSQGSGLFTLQSSAGNVLLQSTNATSTVSVLTADGGATGGEVDITAGNGTTAGGAIDLNAGAGATNGTGGAVTLDSGAGAGTGAGGAMSLDAGAGGVTGAGGAANLTAGAGGATSGAGGALTLAAGSTTSGAAGAVTIDAGDATAGAAGTMTITSGDSGDAAGGLLQLQSGTGGGALAGGEIDLTAGAGGATGAGGAIDINAGAGGATSGTGGAVTINAGAAAGTNSNGGDVTLQAGAGTGTGTDGNTILKTSDNGTASSTNSIIQFQDSTGTEIGRVEDNGDFYGNSFNATSDVQFKTNIRALNDPLSTLRKIEGVTYDWKEGFAGKNGRQQYGVIAQQVEKIIPDVVTGHEGHKAVNYIAMMPFLIESIKQLSAELEELKGEKLAQQKVVEEEVPKRKRRRRRD